MLNNVLIENDVKHIKVTKSTIKIWILAKK